MLFQSHYSISGINSKCSLPVTIQQLFEGLKTTVEQNLHTAELQTTERNYVWEAALAAMQGFIASYAGAAKNPDIDAVAGISLTYAESLIAEGKKRNHI